jgi:hypothetical protein
MAAQVILDRAGHGPTSKLEHGIDGVRRDLDLNPRELLKRKIAELTTRKPDASDVVN